jgi:predicted DNA-binding transcriptional regulator YafY
MPDRPASLQRLLWLYHAFHGAQDGIVPAAALDLQYEEWNVERKTAIRDRKTLEGWGGGGCLRYDPSRRNWQLVRRFALPEELALLQPLPQSQEVLVSVARDILRTSQGPASRVNSVLEGMADAPSPFVSIFAAPRLGRDSQRVSDLWLRLHAAIAAKERVDLLRNGKTTVRVDPLHLWWAQGGWYLLARDVKTRELRNHGLARLEGLERGKGRAGSVEGFDPKKWLGHGDWLYRGGKISVARIRFDAEAVPSFRDRIWQSDVAWEDLPDGSARILHPYPARSHGEWEMARRILGWGQYCTVEGPVPLLRTIKALLAEISSRYD